MPEVFQLRSPSYAAATATCLHLDRPQGLFLREGCSHGRNPLPIHFLAAELTPTKGCRELLNPLEQTTPCDTSGCRGRKGKKSTPHPHLPAPGDRLYPYAEAMETCGSF